MPPKPGLCRHGQVYGGCGPHSGPYDKSLLRSEMTAFAERTRTYWQSDLCMQAVIRRMVTEDGDTCRSIYS